MNGNPPTLNDLDLFLAVARCGSLSKAANKTGVPLPTLSRRMTKFEASTSRRLFLRGKAGYALTIDGHALENALSGLDEVKHRFARWSDTPDHPAKVRITAGIWTSRFLARALKPQDQKQWLAQFVPSNAKLDLARREADIGIRNAPPDHPWLARRKLRKVTHAIYGRSEQVRGFVTLPKSSALPPSQRWLYQTAETDITLTANDTRLCLDLALAGHGRIVMPCFAGDQEPELIRLCDPIAELTHDEWLVSHQDARNDPPIRRALDTITEVLTRD